MTNFLHVGDLPDGIKWGSRIAVDTEAMGLNNHRDRLCVVQLSNGDGDAHLVHFPTAEYHAPNLCALLADTKREKIMHFARFDVSIVWNYLGVVMTPLFCTRTASLLCRTYTDRHGLKELCKEILGVEISKQQQSSNWGAETLSFEQVEYAAADVLYLHKLADELEHRLQRENRLDIARDTMKFIPTRAALDLMGWEHTDIFAHV
jgi:ribonuclease D